MIYWLVGFAMGMGAMYWLMTWKPWDSPPKSDKPHETAGSLIEKRRNPPKTFGRGGQ